MSETVKDDAAPVVTDAQPAEAAPAPPPKKTEVEIIAERAMWQARCNETAAAVVSSQVKRIRDGSLAQRAYDGGLIWDAIYADKTMQDNVAQQSGVASEWIESHYWARVNTLTQQCYLAAPEAFFNTESDDLVNSQGKPKSKQLSASKDPVRLHDQAMLSRAYGLLQTQCGIPQETVDELSWVFVDRYLTQSPLLFVPKSMHAEFRPEWVEWIKRIVPLLVKPESEGGINYGNAKNDYLKEKTRILDERSKASDAKLTPTQARAKSAKKAGRQAARSVTVSVKPAAKLASALTEVASGSATGTKDAVAAVRTAAKEAKLEGAVFTTPDTMSEADIASFCEAVFKTGKHNLIFALILGAHSVDQRYLTQRTIKAKAEGKPAPELLIKRVMAEAYAKRVEAKAKAEAEAKPESASAAA